VGSFNFEPSAGYRGKRSFAMMAVSRRAANRGAYIELASAVEVAVNTLFNVGAPIAQKPAQVPLRRAKGTDRVLIFIRRRLGRGRLGAAADRRRRAC
jgi:hypothetical protein